MSEELERRRETGERCSGSRVSAATAASPPIPCARHTPAPPVLRTGPCRLSAGARLPVLSASTSDRRLTYHTDRTGSGHPSGEMRAAAAMVGRSGRDGVDEATCPFPHLFFFPLPLSPWTLFSFMCFWPFSSSSRT